MGIFLLSRYVLFLVIFASMFGPDEDGFADKLVIPDNIEVAKPLEQLEGTEGNGDDTFQQTILEALKSPGNEDASLTADLPALRELQKKAPAVLRRYLVTSAAWRIFEERGNMFATRRWMIGGIWNYSLHGYYTDSDLEMFSEDRSNGFQSRVTLGLSGQSWISNQRGATTLAAGKKSELNLTIGNDQPTSFCLLPIEGIMVEIFEQSSARERRLTKATLRFLEEEFKPLAESPTWETIQKIVPAGSIKAGEPSLTLRNSMQPGIYTSEIWTNPGEPGQVYLKAFEVTHGTPLSASDLREYSNEWIGWSDDPHQQFRSNALFTIYEGDWGKPYAARFEVWFVPDSGKAERKLMEKVFKIEGWQR